MNKTKRWLEHFQVRQMNDIRLSPIFLAMAEEAGCGQPRGYFFTFDGFHIVFHDGSILGYDWQSDAPGDYLCFRATTLWSV